MFSSTKTNLLSLVAHGNIFKVYLKNNEIINRLIISVSSWVDQFSSMEKPRANRESQQCNRTKRIIPPLVSMIPDNGSDDLLLLEI
ncbi:hypothetical protein DsansV1_C11g0109281 [Dioscorea sansibarensis]